MNIHQSCKMFLSPPAKLVEIENKNKIPYEKTDEIGFRGKNIKYHKKVTMYPRLTIPNIYMSSFS